ncbi:MAG: glycine cleavage system aminomethyltransferase GcvT [Bacteroidales bacterium]
MKNTPFTQKHIELGAKMVPFAGYNMPIEYFGINHEHNHVREKVGLFDVSHMGEIWVKGPSALKFLQYTTSNDLSTLTPGKIQYSCFPNGKGGIVDDFLVYCFNPESWLLVVNASNREKDYNHLTQYAPQFGITPGVDLIDGSDNYCQVAVQGVDAISLVQKLTSHDVASMEYYTFKELQFAGIEGVILSITGYTGSGGVELYAHTKDALQLWDALFEAGKEFDLKAIGLGARDTLRLEMGFCLYGNDIDETTSPIEAGLGWITKFSENKGEFIDRELLLKQKSEGVSRKLVPFELIDRGIPRKGYQVCNELGEEIGVVTSGTMAPALKIPIGLAYVTPQYSKVDSVIYIKVRDKLLKAKVVKAPFYKR